MYRLHRTPINCPVCQALFNEQNLLNEHLRSRTCDVQPPASLKSITSEIEKELKSKKKSDLPPAEKWKGIYKLIFPNEVVPSPCEIPCIFGHILLRTNAQEDYDTSDALSPSASELIEAEDHETFVNRELPEAFREALDVEFQGQMSEELKSLLVANLSDCQQRVSLRYHIQQATVQSNDATEVATMSTPKASSSSFEPLPTLPHQGYNALNMSITGNGTAAPVSWHQTYEIPLSQPLQYPQEGGSSHTDSIDLPRLHARDSGYGSNSFDCYSKCSGCYTCYNRSDLSRRSFDGSSQEINFGEGLGLLLDSHDTNADPGPMTNDILTSVSRSSGNDSLNYLRLQ